MTYSLPLNLPKLQGVDRTHDIIKSWLIESEQAISGVIGVDDQLAVVTVRTFQHSLTISAFDCALREAIPTRATGIICFMLGRLGDDRHYNDRFLAISHFTNMCRIMNFTLLDILFLSDDECESARQCNLL